MPFKNNFFEGNWGFIEFAIKQIFIYIFKQHKKHSEGRSNGCVNGARKIL